MEQQVRKEEGLEVDKGKHVPILSRGQEVGEESEEGSAVEEWDTCQYPAEI